MPSQFCRENISKLSPKLYLLFSLIILLVSLYVANFQYYPFFVNLETLHQNNVFAVTLTLSILTLIAGFILIREKLVWRLIYALSLPFAFLTSYELVWGDAFSFTPTNIGHYLTNHAVIYVSALIVLLTVAFVLTHYLKFNIYYLLLGIGICNIFIIWLSYTDRDLAPLRGWFLPIVPFLLIGFASVRFWHYSRPALFLFLTNIIVFVVWVETGQLHPVTTLAWLLNVTTKCLMALFFVSLLFARYRKIERTLP